MVQKDRFSIARQDGFVKIPCHAESGIFLNGQTLRNQESHLLVDGDSIAVGHPFLKLYVFCAFKSTMTSIVSAVNCAKYNFEIYGNDERSILVYSAIRKKTPERVAVKVIERYNLTLNFQIKASRFATRFRRKMK